MGETAGETKGSGGGRGVDSGPAAPRPRHIPARDSQRGPSPAFWFLAASTAFWAATWAALRFPGTW